MTRRQYSETIARYFGRMREWPDERLFRVRDKLLSVYPGRAGHIECMTVAARALRSREGAVCVVEA